MTPKQQPQPPPQQPWPPYPSQFPSPQQYPTQQQPSPPIRTSRSVSRSRPWRTVLILTAVAVTIVTVIGLAAAVARNVSAPVMSVSSPATQTPVVTSANSSVTTGPAVTVTPAKPAAPPAPARAITARDWAKIAKDPDAHVGESIIVYGQVKQFDSATGADTFRANVDGVKHRVSYGYADYETNTVLTTGGADLSDLVQNDLFQAEVVVIGSLSYDTTLGGTTTVPHLMVNKIIVLGSAK